MQEFVFVQAKRCHEAGTGASRASTAHTTAARTSLKALPKHCLITGTLPAHPLQIHVWISLCQQHSHFNGHPRLHQHSALRLQLPRPSLHLAGTKPRDSVQQPHVYTQPLKRPCEASYRAQLNNQDTGFHFTACNPHARKEITKKQTNNKTNRKET